MITERRSEDDLKLSEVTPVTKRSHPLNPLVLHKNTMVSDHISGIYLINFPRDIEALGWCLAGSV